MNFRKIKSLLRNKKFLIILTIFILIFSYFLFKFTTSKKQSTSYTTSKVEQGTLINTISGSGQVVSLDQIDIKSKISGEVVYLNLKNGKKVNKGDLLLQLDTVEAQKDVWNAKIALENAKLSSKDLTKESNDNIHTVYLNILNALTTNYKDISNNFPQIQSMFVSSSYGSNDEDNNDIDYYLRLVKFIQKNENSDIDLSYWVKTAEQQYLDLKSKYELVQTKAGFLNNSSLDTDIENALLQSYENNQLLLDLTRQTLSLVQKYQYLISTRNISTPISSTTTNTQLNYLTNLNTVLVSNTNALNTLKTTLETTKDTAKKVDVNSETQELTIRQKELDLTTANTNLNNHFVYAPFSGVLTSINSQLKIGDEISNSTSISTIVTNQQIAEITLNEVDIAKVKIDQQVNITFDAISDLTLTGKVIEVDSIGSTEQGVVTYGVKISFDQQDSKVKAGMSLTANIITDVKTDVYIINSSAIKEDENGNYVEILNSDNTISNKYITLGISNDTQTEVIDGIGINDNIIIKTTTNSKNTKNSTNSFSMPGMGGDPIRMR